VVITMRADFLGDCAPHRNLVEVLETCMQLIAPMTTAELRSAMEQQAGAVGLRFEADLAYTILEDVEREPGAMPLLQHALLELWHRRHGRWLLATEYREGVGTIRGTITRTAETLYGALSAPEQETMRAVLVRLTQPGVESRPGEAYRPPGRGVSRHARARPTGPAGTGRRRPAPDQGAGAQAGGRPARGHKRDGRPEPGPGRGGPRGPHRPLAAAA
jgi:hypothetical protein